MKTQPETRYFHRLSGSDANNLEKIRSEYLTDDEIESLMVESYENKEEEELNFEV